LLIRKYTMNHKNVITELEKKYPGKLIIKLPENEPTEILCEIESTVDHPEYSMAIAVIDRSVPHYHKEVTELYEVLKGKLSVYVDGVEHKLEEGDKLEIKPGSHHYAVGDETRVRCTARPGWTISDHILSDTKQKRVDN